MTACSGRRVEGRPELRLPRPSAEAPESGPDPSIEIAGVEGSAVMSSSEDQHRTINEKQHAVTLNKRPAVAMASTPLGPFKLVTVNTAPERAKRLIGRVVDDVKDKYTIIHAANVDNIDGVAKAVEEIMPDILFTASMWTPEEAQRIIQTAKAIKPDLMTFSLPQGLQVQKGPDAVVEYIKENLPSILDK